MYGRTLIESRFGPLGCGQQTIEVCGTTFDIPALLAQLGIVFDDMKPIDVAAIDDHYVVRYLDAQDSRIVAHEFTNEFRTLSEIRAHLAEWIGNGDYFSSYAGH